MADQESTGAMNNPVAAGYAVAYNSSVGERVSTSSVACRGIRLTQAAVDSLPDGALVTVDWGGCGGAYRVRVDEWGVRCAAPVSRPSDAPVDLMSRLDGVGAPPLTAVSIDVEDLIALIRARQRLLDRLTRRMVLKVHGLEAGGWSEEPLGVRIARASDG